MISDRQKIFRELHELTEFCLANRGKCFAGWTREKLFFYLGFHRLAGTLFVVRTGRIEAVGVAFTARPEQILAHTAGETYFHWRLPEPGNALVIFDVIGRRATVAKLFRMASRKWPAVRRFFTWRREALKEISTRKMEAFCRG
jgi:hypothetical protein